MMNRGTMQSNMYYSLGKDEKETPKIIDPIKRSK